MEAKDFLANKKTLQAREPGQGRQFVTSKMRFALFFSLFLSLLLGTARKLKLHDKKSIDHVLDEMRADIKKTGKGMQLMKMSSETKDKIGLQKFGPLFEAFETIPPKLKIYAFNRIIGEYHYWFGCIPPRGFLDPFLAKQNDIFLTATAGTLKRLELTAVRYARGKDVLPQNAGDLEKAAQMFLNFMAEFRTNREVFKEEIDVMFPIPSSYEEALKDTLTTILLIQRTFQTQIKKDLRNLNTVFRCQKGCRCCKKDGTTAKKNLIHRIMWFCVSRYVCNKLLKKTYAGLRMGDREAVIEVHAFAFKSCSYLDFDTLPRLAVEFLRSKIGIGREREFATWKVMRMSAKVANFNRDLNILFRGLMTRIKLSLKQFISMEEVEGKINLLTLECYDTSIKKFEQAVQVNQAHPSFNPEQARKFYLDKFNREIPEILASDPEFEDFRDLSDDQMNAILQAIRECDVPPPSFMDFGGATVVEREEVGHSESSSKRADDRRARRARRKRQARLARQTQPSRTRATRKDHLTPSELIVDPVDEMTAHLDKSLEMKSGIEDKTIGKEEASEESGSSNSVEESSDSEVSVTEYDYEDDQAKISEEWKLIEEEQLRVIEHYKLLAKLENAKLRHNKVRFQMESNASKEKRRVVASFRTEDFRYLNSKANQLFIDNQEAETVLTVLNSRKSVTLRWIFNPSVTIDRDAYHFLCQLFGLAHGSNHLTFPNFIRTFQLLNPSKSKLNRKELSRSVFQFEHAFETEDEVYVPPIGGGHREHLSSAFNHIQIRQFMMNGGAHPYFFELIKYN